jgi:hypothetical protein
MFHSRETHFVDRVPYLEASWDDSVRTGSVQTVPTDSDVIVNVTNLRGTYRAEEKTRMRLFVRPRDYNPAVVMTASLGPQGVVVDPAYYRVENDRTGEVVIPYGTGSNPESTRLSYDSSGSYFDMWMRNLPPGNAYRLLFILGSSSDHRVVDQDLIFRVVS